LSIFPLETKLPSIDPEKKNEEPVITRNAEEKIPQSEKATKQISDLSLNVDSTRKMLDNILNTNTSVSNINNSVGDTNTHDRRTTNQNSIENVFNRNDMNSLIQNISSTKNENTTTSPNYIKSSISLPFIKNETRNDNIDSSSSSVSNIKVSKPTISKFSNITNARSQFTKENSHFTNKIQSSLANSPTIKIFERGKNVIKSTKEVMNHLTTRQNNVIPMLEYGGMVNSPTLAMVGESGPESIIPAAAGRSSSFSPKSKTLQSLVTEDGNKSNTNSISMKKSMESISNSANGSSNSNNMKMGAAKKDSITSLANDTLQERASHQAQSTAANIKSGNAKDAPITLQANDFAKSTPTKQTPPAAGAAGGEAGSSSFSSYFRNRIFSLPSWRQRLT
jgi:hypothetical protein